MFCESLEIRSTPCKSVLTLCLQCPHHVAQMHETVPLQNPRHPATAAWRPATSSSLLPVVHVICKSWWGGAEWLVLGWWGLVPCRWIQSLEFSGVSHRKPTHDSLTTHRCLVSGVPWRIYTTFLQQTVNSDRHATMFPGCRCHVDKEDDIRKIASVIIKRD